MSETLEKLQLENRILKQILDEVLEGVYVTDENEVISWLNRSAAEADGVDRKEVIGRSEAEVYQNISRFHRLTAKTGRPLPRRRVHYYLPDGRRTDLLLTTKPFFEAGRMKAIYTLGYDINHLRKLMGLAQEFEPGTHSGSKIKDNQTRYVFSNIVGQSDVLKKTLKIAKKATLSRANILIIGETGTGKEVLAQSIHNAGPQAEGRFAAVNCSAIPETLLEGLLFGTAKGAFTGASDTPGLFEYADGGSLFLDEVNSMPVELQTKMLRVLQEKEVQRLGEKKPRRINCRILSAMNVDPASAVRDRTLREDLYYRLSTITIDLPPLRVRPDDIPLLLDHFIQKHAILPILKSSDLSPEVRRIFSSHAWPGNNRELEHTVEYILAMMEPGESIIEAHHLPPSFHQASNKAKSAGDRSSDRSPSPSLDLQSRLDDVERDIISTALADTDGNLTKASEKLGLSRQVLTYRIRRLGLGSRPAPVGIPVAD